MRPAPVLAAFASLLLGIGLGAMVTENPTLAPQFIIAAIAVYAMAGILTLPVARRALPFLRTKEDTDDLLREFLAACLSDVAGFRQRNAEAETDESFASRVARLENWIADTSLHLDDLRPGWGALFLSNPIYLQYGSGSPWSNFRNHLAQREAALRDLMKLLR